MDSNEVILRRMRTEDIPKVKALHEELFPVRYSEGFYSGFFVPNVIAIVAEQLSDTSIVGVATCRISDSENSILDLLLSHKQAYIMTIGVTNAKRKQGLGARLLQRIRDQLLEDEETKRISKIYLHVQASNQEAIKFYLHHGFITVTREVDYYHFGPEDSSEQDHCPDAFYMLGYVNSSISPSSSTCSSLLRWFGF